jgi:PAS domain S-box-containing protein
MNSKGTIMVVDDTHASLKLLADYLSEEGYKVHAADSGKLALASVEKSPPELILLDIRMPDMDGFEVIRQLKARPESCDIPVIFLSAVTELDQRIEGLKMGAVDFISKPFQRNELVARVQTHLELFRLRTRSETQAQDLRRINEQLTVEILERKQADAAMRESEEKFHSLYTHMVEGAALHKLTYNDQGIPEDYIIVEINPAFEKLLGISRDTVISKTSREAYGVVEPPYLEIYAQVALTGEPNVFETYFPPLLKHFSISAYCPYKGSFATIFEDITERKRAEEALRESKALFEAVVENVPLMIFLKEATDLRFVIFNRAGEELLGYDRKALLGKNNLDLFPQEQAAHFMSKDREVLDGDAGFLDIPEESITTAKKGVRLLHTRKICIRGADGTTKFLLGISEDITERRRAEEALKKSRIQLAEAADLAHLVNWELDVATGIFTFDDRFYTLYGTTAELEGGNQIPAEVYARKFVHPDDQYMVANEVNKAIQATDPGYVSQVEHRIIRRDGEIRHIVVRFGITKDANGRTIRTHGGNQDITDRKQMEDALRLEKDLWRGTFESIPDYIAIIDADHHVLQVNKAMADALKVSPDAAQGIFCYQAVHGTTGPPSYCPHEMMLKDGKTHTTEVELPLLNGYFSLTTSPLFKPDGTIFGSVHLAHDITERKKAEDLLKHFNEELEQKVKARTEELNASLDEKVILLREVHHRVKNNLQILISLLNLQSRTFNDTQVIAALKESTQRIRAMSMVHEKLYSGSDLSHIDFISYLTTLAKSQVAFYQLEPGKVTLETTGENIMLDINTAIPLGLVMNELLSNSLKHAFPGDRKGTIRIDARETEGRLEISISDDGVGLPEGFDYSTSPSLGLRLVHILIEQLSGTIEPKKEKGTMFTIVIKEKQ